LYSLIEGKVQFERFGKQRQKLSVYPVE